MVGERLPRLRVEEGHGAILVSDCERASVGAERDRPDRIAVALQDADRRGTAQQRREQVAAGRDRVVERGRPRAASRSAWSRRSRSAPRRRGAGRRQSERRRVRRRAGEARASPPPTRDRERRRAAASSVRRRRLTTRLRSASRSLARRAGVEEVALEPVQLVAAFGAQSSADASRAPRRARPGRARRCPNPRRKRDAAVKPPALGVLLEPASQPRPFPQQRLMRDLGLPSSTVTSRLSASAASTRATRSSRSASSSASGTRRRTQRRPPPRPASRNRMRRASGLVVTVEPPVARASASRATAPCTRRCARRRRAAAAAVAALPELEQRGREQGQRRRPGRPRRPRAWSRARARRRGRPAVRAPRSPRELLALHRRRRAPGSRRVAARDADTRRRRP